MFLDLDVNFDARRHFAAGRLGTPEDLAVVICTLVSPMSGFVTGANYRVDGGQIRSVN